jgi:adenylate cyclase class IV
MFFLNKIIKEFNRAKEIERIFIVSNLEITEITEKLENLGFEKKIESFQLNRIYDNVALALLKNQKYLRIRLKYDIDNDDLHNVKGELSYNHRRMSKEKNDIRRQIKLDIEKIEDAEILDEIFSNIGLYQAYNMKSKRIEYGKTELRQYWRDIHIEIDTDIIFLDPKGKTILELDPTLQLCVETTNTIMANQKIDSLMKELNLKTDKIESHNYYERFLLKKGVKDVLHKK